MKPVLCLGHKTADSFQMCPKEKSLSLLERWERARARIFAFEASDRSKEFDHWKWLRETDFYKNRPPEEPNISDSQLDAEFQHREQIKPLRETALRLLHEGVRDEGLSAPLMRRLEAHLDRLWTEDGWQDRFHECRARLETHPGALEAFDGLIRDGCYADVVAAGVGEVVSQSIQRMPPPGVRKRAREHARRLEALCDELAQVNEAAAQDWPGEYAPVFSQPLTDTLRDEAARLEELAKAFDLRHKNAVRPLRLTYFLAATNHIKDVTGTHHDKDIATILDALGVKIVAEDTIGTWRRRAAKEKDAPSRRLVDLRREMEKLRE